jgi:SAM-dependent methyltransferase
MNPREYANLANVERHHWFYVGKREIVRHWIRRVHPLRPAHLLVDCGAGTGTFAAELAAVCRVLAIDDHEESLALARTQLGANQVRRGTCVSLPLDSNSVDVLTALDVLEHVEDDRKAMAEFSRVVRPGGIVVITVPALMQLWSDWDVALHHFRRYARRSLVAVIPKASFEVVHCNYVNVVALPLVLMIRKWRAFKCALGFQVASRSEDTIPPGWLNDALRWSFVRLACQGLIRFPAGVGLLAVLRRK